MEAVQCEEVPASVPAGSNLEAIPADADTVRRMVRTLAWIADGTRDQADDYVRVATETIEHVRRSSFAAGHAPPPARA